MTCLFFTRISSIYKPPLSLLACCYLAVIPLVAQAACPVLAPAEKVAVKRVVDGDTVWLADGRKLRLVGFNTPELGSGKNRNKKPAEPLAKEARQQLADWLKSATSLTLVQGGQRQDRHGRYLAHLYDGAGQHAGEYLLRQGLAHALAISPEVRLAECLFEAEQHARQQRLGVWAHPYYSVRTVAQLKSEDAGFRRVQGILTAVVRTRRAVWLWLDHSLALRIPADKLAYFSEQELSRWQGRRLIARGWLIDRRSRPIQLDKAHVVASWMMTVTHPAMLEWAENPVK